MSFNFEFNKTILRSMIPSIPYIDYWHASLIDLLPEYNINTKLRVAAFMAQTAHESGNYKFLRENLNYRAETLMRQWPKYFPNLSIAKQYAGKEQMIANRAYANRMGNGDEASGDGWLYCGRGLIQLTGKNNYTFFAGSLNITPEEASEYLETFEGATQGACFFWEMNNLNDLADSRDMVTLTKRIQGADGGLEDRIKKYNHICKVLEI